MSLTAQDKIFQNGKTNFKNLAAFAARFSSVSNYFGMLFITHFFYKQHFYKQSQVEIGKKTSKTYATP